MANKPTSPVAQNHIFHNDLFRAYLNYEGTGTTTADLSTYNKTANFAFGSGGSNPEWEYNGVEEGYTIKFNDRSYLDCDDNYPDSVDLGNKFTVMVRFKFTASTDILAARNPIGSVNTIGDWVLKLESSNKVSFIVRNTAGSAVTVTHSQVLSTNTWYVAVGTYDGSNITIRINEVSVSKTQTGDIRTGTSPANIKTTQKFNSNSGTGAGLRISYMFIWLRVLSENEIDSYSDDPYTGIWITATGTETYKIFDDSTTNSNNLLGIIVSGYKPDCLDSVFGRTNTFVSSAVGHVKDFSITRSASGDDFVEVFCEGFQSFVRDTINLNYPDIFDYWVSDFGGADQSNVSPNGLTTPNTFDHWPITNAYKTLLIRSFIDPTLFLDKNSYLTKFGSVVSGLNLIQESDPNLILEYNLNYGNPSLGIIASVDESFQEDSEYMITSNFGTNIQDYINAIIEPYGWDWGSRSFDDGSFYLRTRDNPSNIIVSDDFTKSGSFTDNYHADAISGTSVITTTAGDYIESTVSGQRIDAVITLNNSSVGGAFAVVSSGISLTQLDLLPGVQGGSFSVGNRVVLNIDGTLESTRITDITNNTYTFDDSFTTIPVSGTLMWTAVSKYTVTRTSPTTEIVVSGFLYGFNPFKLDNILTIDPGARSAGSTELSYADLITSGSRRYFYNGIDPTVNLNLNRIKLVGGLTRDDYNVKIERLPDSECESDTELGINALLVYDSDINTPVESYYTQPAIGSGMLMNYTTNSLGSDVRNDVIVVGRRIGASVPGGLDNPSINPNNPNYVHFVSRSTDNNSIFNKDSVNFVGRPIQTILTDPDIASQSRADYWSMQFLNRYSRLGKTIEFSTIYNPTLEVGDCIEIIDSDKLVVNASEKLWISEINTTIDRNKAISSYKATSFPPWESFVPRLPLNTANFNDSIVDNISITPVTHYDISSAYDPYRKDEDGTIIKIRFDLIKSGFLRIQIIDYEGNPVADLLNIDGDFGRRGWIRETAGSNKLVSWDGVDQYGIWNRDRLNNQGVTDARAADKDLPKNWFVAEDVHTWSSNKEPARLYNYYTNTFDFVGRFYVKFMLIDDTGTITTKTYPATNQFDANVHGKHAFTINTKRRALPTTIYSIKDKDGNNKFFKWDAATRSIDSSPNLGFLTSDDIGFSINTNNNPVMLNITMHPVIYGLVLNPAPFQHRYVVTSPLSLDEYVIINRKDFRAYNGVNDIIKLNISNYGFEFDDFFGYFGATRNLDVLLNAKLYMGWYFLFVINIIDKSGRQDTVSSLSKTTQYYIHKWEGNGELITDRANYSFYKKPRYPDWEKINGHSVGQVWTTYVDTVISWI